MVRLAHEQSGGYETLRIRKEQDILYVQMYRPEAKNAINDKLIAEMDEVLEAAKQYAKVVVLQGLPEVFCFGADFNQIAQKMKANAFQAPNNPEPLYNIWLNLATGPYISIAQVKGKTNAGGVGFVAACDVVLCERGADFGLSELLFGLIPACVLPFLIRRVGESKANYMTLMTQSITAEQAVQWGLADALDDNVDNLLRKHLLRLRRLDKSAIMKHKTYMNSLSGGLISDKAMALKTNQDIFSDVKNINKISTYVDTGQFPWEQ